VTARKKRYGRKGVTKAASHIGKELAAAVIGQDATNQRAIDQTMMDTRRNPEQSETGG
jgi:enolase